MARRGAVDLMLPIAILLIILVGVSTSKGGVMGKLGSSLSKTMTNLFGNESTQCAFLQKGALSSILLGGERISTDVLGYSKAAHDTTTLLGSDSCIGGAYASQFEVTLGSEENTITYINETNDISCSTNWGNIVQGTALVNGGGKGDALSSKICTGDSTEFYACCDAQNGPCMCTEEDPAGEETGTQQTGGFYPCTLRYWLLTEAMGFNGAAAADAEFGRFASRKMPPLICIMIFGLVPFVVMYYLFQDLLAMMFISPTSKKLICFGNVHVRNCEWRIC